MDLHKACSSGPPSAVRKALANPFSDVTKPNCDEFGIYPLYAACSTTNVASGFVTEICDILIAKGAKINQINDGDARLFPLFRVCAQHRSLKLARYFVEKGANVNLSNGAGMTSLHMAGNHKLSDVVAFLLESGASVDQTCDNNCNALIIL